MTAEAFIRHAGTVLDLLLQDKELDPVSQTFVSSSPLPLDFVDESTPPYIKKVDVALHRVAQKMYMLEQELARHKRQLQSLYPAEPLDIDIALPPPILTPPVNSLLSPTSASSRWNEGHWEFINHPPTYTSIQSDRQHPFTQQSSSLTRFIDTPVPANASVSDSTLANVTAASATVSPSVVTTDIPRSHASNTPTMAVSTKTTTSTACTEKSSPCAECVHSCALVAAAVAKGDLAVRIVCPSMTCNQSSLVISMNFMVAKLSNFTKEVIQVAAQGVEGKFGVQAQIQDESGIWKEFVNHLNTMTVGHSEQVRDIATVCTAVAHGDLSKKVTINVKGETLVLKNTINTMVEQLRSFSSEVTRVAHEVGTEGKLGGQAHVKGVDGTWKELTDNVNTMAANLTAQ
ncbi:hypothetical protein BG011_010083, partial [Mortierella polycephala]